MDRVVETKLLNWCDELGSFDERAKAYRKGIDCKSALADILNHLKSDRKNDYMRSHFGKVNLIESDLIPIIEQFLFVDDDDMFRMIIRLMSMLTTPTLLLFERVPDDDRFAKQQFMSFESYLQNYKLTFSSHPKFFEVMTEQMSQLVPIDDRDAKQDRMLDSILVLVRNILHISYNDDASTADDVSCQDQIIKHMYESGFFEVLLRFTKIETNKRSEFCSLILEIVYLLLKDQNAKFLAQSVDESCVKRSYSEAKQDKEELKELLSKDKNRNSFRSQAKFSRFQNSTYQVKNMKSISDREVIFHRTPKDKITFDTNKRLFKNPGRNYKKILSNATQADNHRSSYQIRFYLHWFSRQFLEVFNNFMNTVSYRLLAKKDCSNNYDQAETKYFWSLQFFMEFNRNYANLAKLRLTTQMLSMASFHFVQDKINDFMESLNMQKTDKEALVSWSKRLQTALKAYKELLLTLSIMSSSKDEEMKEDAKKVMRSLFYEEEYRHFLRNLLIYYKEKLVSQQFLIDLIETNHIYLKILEAYCSHRSRLLVQQKKKVSRTKRKNKPKNELNGPKDESSEEIWTENHLQISEIFIGNKELPSPSKDSSICPFDPLSEKSLEKQKLEAMIRIQELLRKKDAIRAVALFRSAREYWNDEEQAFGAPDIQPEAEMEALKEIFEACLLKGVPNKVTQEEEEEEEEETKQKMVEVEFKIEEEVMKFCKMNVVKALATALKTFDTNSPVTNHCVLKMLHRIAWDCKMYSLLFQASIFKTFQRILQEDTVNKETSAVFRELKEFAKFIINKFVSLAKNNKELLIELLFWKTKNDAHGIIMGFDHEEKGHVKILWSEEEEYELEKLAEEYKQLEKPDKSAINFIVSNLIEPKTSKQVIKQLKNQVRKSKRLLYF